MTRVNKIPVCSLIDFYQCIPDYEDVMHLPSHELDERLRDLRSMQKSYLSDDRSSPLFTADFHSDYGYLREDYRDFIFPTSEGCSRICPYGSPTRSSKYDKLLTSFESTARESGLTPFPKDSAGTTPSTLSNKSSAAFSNGDDTPSKSTSRARRKKNNSIKTKRSTSYFYSPPPGLPPGPPLYRSGSPSFPDDYDCDDVYGASWIESHPPKLPKEQRSLPCSPVHRRFAKTNTDKQRRSRLLSYLSTPDVRVHEEKPSYVFRAQPFPSHIFSNYLNKRREEKLTNRAVSRRMRAEELQKASSLPPSMRRRQKGSAITVRSEQPKACDNSERHIGTISPSRFRYTDLSPYRKMERRSSGNKRRSRPTSVEARDNLASLLRLQASRQKLEAESAAAAEMAATNAERRMRTRAMRLSPVWHSALSRPTTAEDLMLKAARRREEAAERKRRRRRSVAAMRERVRAAPTLMERQSLIRTVSSLGRYSSRDSALKSAKHSERFRRPTTADVWKCYSINHNGYSRSHTQLSSYLPKRRRSRVVISHKNSFSDDEVQRQCRQKMNPRQKHSFSHKKDFREVYYDTPEDDYDYRQRSRPSSPIKSRSSLNYGSPVGDHPDDLTEEENLPPSRHSPSYISAGRNSRADMSFSDSHGEDSQIPQEHGQNSSSDLRNQTYNSNEFKHTEQSDEASYSKSVSRDELATFEFDAKSPPFLKSETWPWNSAKGDEYYKRSLSLGYENGRMEEIRKRFEDISLRSSSPTREPVIETNFENCDRSEQPCSKHCRSTQSSPQLRRRTLHHDFKTIHDSITGLDLASHREYFNDGNLRYNIRSPKRPMIQTRSADARIT